MLPSRSALVTLALLSPFAAAAQTNHSDSKADEGNRQRQLQKWNAPSDPEPGPQYRPYPLTTTGQSLNPLHNASSPGWVLSGSTPHLYDLIRAPGPVNRLSDLAETDPRCGSTVLRSLPTSEANGPRGFGTMMQAFRADKYRGQRVRLSAYVQPLGVKGWAGLWARVDGPDRKKALAFDNMQERPLRADAECARYEVVLDVAPEASVIALGLLLSGEGAARIGNVHFEVVDKASTPSTDLLSSAPRLPVLDAPNLTLDP